MKSDKRLYKFFPRRNITNDDYINDFDDYVKFILSYGGSTPIYPGLVKSNLTKIGSQYTRNITP